MFPNRTNQHAPPKHAKFVFFLLPALANSKFIEALPLIVQEFSDCVVFMFAAIWRAGGGKSGVNNGNQNERAELKIRSHSDPEIYFIGLVPTLPVMVLG